MSNSRKKDLNRHATSDDDEASITMMSREALRSVIDSLKKAAGSNFNCAVCSRPCTDTHIIPECLHRFCGSCIKESIRKEGKKCPVCDTVITKTREVRKDAKYGSVVSWM